MSRGPPTTAGSSATARSSAPASRSGTGERSRTASRTVSHAPASPGSPAGRRPDQARHAHAQPAVRAVQREVDGSAAAGVDPRDARRDAGRSAASASARAATAAGVASGGRAAGTAPPAWRSRSSSRARPGSAPGSSSSGDPRQHAARRGGTKNFSVVSSEGTPRCAVELLEQCRERRTLRRRSAAASARRARRAPVPTGRSRSGRCARACPPSRRGPDLERPERGLASSRNRRFSTGSHSGAAG